MKFDDDVGASTLSRSSGDNGREVKLSSFLKLSESLDLGNDLDLESCEEKTTRSSYGDVDV